MGEHGWMIVRSSWFVFVFGFLHFSTCCSYKYIYTRGYQRQRCSHKNSSDRSNERLLIFSQIKYSDNTSQKIRCITCSILNRSLTHSCVNRMQNRVDYCAHCSVKNSKGLEITLNIYSSSNLPVYKHNIII